MAAVLSTTEAQSWDCTSSDLSGYHQLLQQQQGEAYVVMYSVAWAPEESSASAGSQYLVAGTSTGDIRLYSVSQLLQHQQSSACGSVAPLARIAAHQGPVYTCVFAQLGAESMLLSGGDDGKLHCWRWSQLLALARREDGTAQQRQQRPVAWSDPVDDVSPAATLLSPGVVGPWAAAHEVNALAVDGKRGLVAAGCGDGMFRTWDLARMGQGSTQPLTAVAAHRSAVMDMAVNAADGCLATASQDGLVCEWDGRSSTPATVIHPPTTTSSSVPQLCVDYDGSGNWLVAGNAQPSILCWSRIAGRAADPVSARASPQALRCLVDKIAVGSAEPQLACYSFAGKELSLTPCSASSVFTLAACPEAGLLAAGGSGGHLDVLLLSNGGRVGVTRKPVD